MSQANYVCMSLGKPSKSKGYDVGGHESRLSSHCLQAHISGQVIIINVDWLVCFQCLVAPSLNLYVSVLTGDSVMSKQKNIYIFIYIFIVAHQIVGVQKIFVLAVGCLSPSEMSSTI